MAISIDWGTSVVSVPKADLTLIQATPTEIREMNLNWFRLQLKALEASAAGIGFLRTHIHNTEVTLGALTFARVVEMINGYTVTFEDGQYAVDLVGANSNVGDVSNVNQVSVRSYNSAGLISSPAIEYASFNGGVIVDQYSGHSGTVFPRGTEQMPVDNITDALLIAQYRGFNRIYFHSDYDIDSGSDLSNFVIIGESHVNTNITILTTADVTGATFIDCHISGVLDGGNTLEKCIVGDLEYVNGHIHNCGLTGTIVLAGNEVAAFMDCGIIDPNLYPIIDMGGSGQDVVFGDWSGGIIFKNLTGTNKIAVQMDGGKVTLDSTINGTGIIGITGIGLIVDNATAYTNLQTDGLVNKQTITEAVWEADPAEFLDIGTFGRLMYHLSDVLGLVGKNTKWSDITFDANHLMTGARITYYDDNTLITPFQSWDIVATYDGDGELLSYQMVEV